MIVVFGRVMRGAIDAAIKGKRQAKGGNYRGGAIYGGETDKSMGTVVIGGMAGIVQRRGQYHHPPPLPPHLTHPDFQRSRSRRRVESGRKSVTRLTFRSGHNKYGGVGGPVKGMVVGEG